MTAEFLPIDRDKDHLIRADYDSVRIADALRRSPHFTAAYANPGDYDVVFATSDTGDGRAWLLTLKDPAPSDDDMLGEPVLHEALAAAVLNHPDFVGATPDYPSDGDITIHTRDGQRYLGVIGIATDEDTALLKQPSPAVDVALAADKLLASDPSDSERATAELLSHIAATWDKQDLPLREHTQAVARTLRTQ
ncbi:hypothetical protein [Streptomyces sp. NPDC003006]